MTEQQWVDGAVERFSERTGRGAIRLVDGRVAIFTVAVVERSGIPDLRPGDAVAVELKAALTRASAAAIRMRGQHQTTRTVRRRISKAEQEMREGVDRPL